MVGHAYFEVYHVRSRSLFSLHGGLRRPAVLRVKEVCAVGRYPILVFGLGGVGFFKISINSRRALVALYGDVGMGKLYLFTCRRQVLERYRFRIVVRYGRFFNRYFRFLYGKRTVGLGCVRRTQIRRVGVVVPVNKMNIVVYV